MPLSVQEKPFMIPVRRDHSELIAAKAPAGYLSEFSIVGSDNAAFALACALKLPISEMLDCVSPLMDRVELRDSAR
jgi:hypothetical protein